MNLDETSVGVVQKPTLGVVMKAGKRVRVAVPSRLRVTRGSQRLNLTYVALVSDDPDFTRELPQFIIGDARSFPIGIFHGLFVQAPTMTFLMRAGSAWCTYSILIRILRLLGHVCRNARPGALVVLCLDTVNSHINLDVLRTFHEENIRPLFVPARTTSLLQPLDVYVFRVFKERLRRQFHDRYAVRSEGVDMQWFLSVLYEVIDEVIVTRPWPHIFQNLGLSDRQLLVSVYLRAHVDVPVLQALEPGPPTDADVAALLPRGRRISAAQFLPPAPEPLIPLEHLPVAARLPGF